MPAWIRMALGLFLAACCYDWLRSLASLPPAGHWTEAVLLLLALPASVAALAHYLPTLNVVMAGALAALVGSFVIAVDQAAGLPFSSVQFHPASGPVWLSILPWSAPCLWFVLALTARGTARFLLHRQSPRPGIGYQVLILATLIGVGLSLLVANYGEQNELWTLPNERTPLALAILLGLHLVQQIVVTPLLLDKFPHPRPANPLPLLVIVPSILLLLLTLATR